MSSLFVPDYMFAHFHDITPEFLHSIGISALLIDIDNTLAPYEVDEPDERIELAKAMRSEGKSYQQIADELGLKSRTSALRLLNK